MSVTKILDEMSDAFSDVALRFFDCPEHREPVSYTKKEIQMFKKLCKKFLDRLEEDENEL